MVHEKNVLVEAADNAGAGAGVVAECHYSRKQRLVYVDERRQHIGLHMEGSSSNTVMRESIDEKWWKDANEINGRELK